MALLQLIVKLADYGTADIDEDRMEESMTERWRKEAGRRGPDDAADKSLPGRTSSQSS